MKGDRIKKNLGIKGNVSTSIKTRKREARKQIHKFIRIRDTFIRGDGHRGRCCACGTWVSPDEAHAGHYRHGILLDERNIHLECVTCNTYLHGNLDNYYVFMVETFDQEVADKYRTMPNPIQKYKWYELYEIEQLYKRKIERMLELGQQAFKKAYNYNDNWFDQLELI
jgi:hypothetical protein